jgi:hypothetical protein
LATFDQSIDRLEQAIRCQRMTVNLLIQNSKNLGAYD